MTDNPPSPGEQSADLAVLAADTLLLDTLGRGEPASTDDRVASLLAAWREDLTADLAAVESQQAAGLQVARPVAAEAGDAGRRGGRTHRVGRRVLGAAAAVLVAGGGLAVGAGHATPGNPLWPITRVMYPEHADDAAAEHAVAQARQAAVEGRHDDARRLLARAETLIARVADPGRAQRLRTELTTVREMVPATGPNTSAPATPTPAPTGPAGGPVPTGPDGGPAPLPTRAAPEPTVSAGGAPALPPVVTLPPPAVTVPTPGLGVPTPVPTVGLLPPPVGGLLPRLP
jgi:hypothetical protein